MRRSADVARLLPMLLLCAGACCTPRARRVDSVSPARAVAPVAVRDAGRPEGGVEATALEAGMEAAPVEAAPMDAASAAVPARRTLDKTALAALVVDARRNDSDELVILKDGRLVGDWNFTHRHAPIQTMSITKSVLALAVGCLVDAGKLRLDEPAYDFFPRWKRDGHRAITLYHLLSHSSGLEAHRTTLPIYRSKSFVDVSLRTKLAYKPGTHYHYSNRAANLVSAIVQKASGLRTDRYVDKRLFRPLGIHRWWWARDRAGQPEGMAGLHLEPRDLAKIGELVRLDGEYDGRRIVSAAWIHRATAEAVKVQPESRRLGLLWWLVPAWRHITLTRDVLDKWRDAGVDAAFVECARPLAGRTFTSTRGFLDALEKAYADPGLARFNARIWKQHLPDAHFELGPTVGSYAEGTLGQFLVVLPRDGLVAVRMRRRPAQAADRDKPRLDFVDFVERVQGLVH